MTHVLRPEGSPASNALASASKRRSLRLGFETTGYSRLAFAVLVGSVLISVHDLLFFLPAWMRATITMVLVLLGVALLTRKFETRLIFDGDCLEVVQPSRSLSVAIPWSSISSVAVTPLRQLRICRASGETLTLGPFRPSSLEGKPSIWPSGRRQIRREPLDVAVELARSAIAQKRAESGSAGCSS